MRDLLVAQIGESSLAPSSAPARLIELLTFRAGYNANLVLLGTILLGVASAVVGCFLLLRRRSLVADALSHAALPGVCVGFLLGWWLGIGERNLLVLLAGAAAFALLGVACVHLIASLPRIQEDAAIGVVLSVFFAIGVVLLKLIEQTPTGSIAGLNRFIFGSAASMVAQDLLIIIALAAVCLVTALLLYKELRLTCFDAAFARSIGRPTGVIDALLLGLVTLITVAGLHSVGAILMVALLIIPPAAARFWTDRLWVMLLLAGTIGGAGCWAGTAASVVLDDIPTGPAIVVACGALFIVSMLFAPRRGILLRRLGYLRAKRSIGRMHLLRAMFEIHEQRAHAPSPIPSADLIARRGWTAARLHSLLRGAIRRGDVEAAEGGFRLTRSGLEAAREIVRRHRLWEHYLTTLAQIDPTHVDRPADTMEHVLDEEFTRRIEAALRRRGDLSEGAEIPASPHQLGP